MPNTETAAATGFLSLLRDLVSHESPTHDRAALNRLADHLQGILQAGGWTVERRTQDEAGDHLIARTGPESGTSTLLLTHYDTVWPVGTLADMPLRQEDGRLYGPGVLDMKAGIAIAIRAVADADSLAGPVTLLLTSDEETGSLTSRSLIEEQAVLHDRVLVLEPARDDGAVKLGRKGVGDYDIHFHGVSAHAGNSPELGASALRELSHYLLYAESLSEDGKGTTVNVTGARGGAARNVIAEKATASIDFRVLVQSEAERIDRSLRAYHPRDSRVKVTVEGGLNRPPLEQTEGNRKLWETVRQTGLELGLELEGAVVGGGSDGSFTSALGVPTLDGLGAVGAGPHARHEQIDIARTTERLRLLTALLAS